MRAPRGASLALNASACAALAIGWYGILRAGSASAAFAYFLASRTAYVSFTGLALRAQDESSWWTRRWGAEEGFRRFRSATSLFMHNDAVSIVLVCWTSRGSLQTDLPDWVPVALGAVLLVLGFGVKTWAMMTLGFGSYYWKSFFIAPKSTRYVVSGPYRWFENPMYTLGYVHAYGIALVLHSLPGLIAALVAQSLMLLFNHWAERPFTEKMRMRAAGADAAD